MKIFKRIVFAVIGIIAVIIVGVVGSAYFAAARPPTFVNEKLVFQHKLAIPPLLEPTQENGEKVFDLRMQAGTTAILDGAQTQTLGFNGSILGPTIRVKTGDMVRMNVTNGLDETATVHWHGMHLPAAMDGGPHQTIAPGKTWQPHWPITNQAATLWYHPHTMEKTALQVYRGLAGLFIIDDDNSDSLNLPSEYGVDDIPLIVQDRKFDSDNQLIYDHTHMQREITTGMLGDTILVNHTYAPYADVPAKRIRLRIVNGSNARRYNFGFSDNRTFHQIATDGGLLPEPIERTRIPLSPGERAEILIDLSNQKKALTLLSYPVAGDTNKIRDFALGLIAGGTDEHQQFNILELRPHGGNYATQEIPPTLNTIKPFRKGDAAKTREFKLDTAAINGRKMNSSRVDAVVRKGDLEIWHIRNESPVYHPFHIHGVQFQVLDRNGQKPPPYETGWKDTISLNPSESVSLIMQFTDYSDPGLPYMFHCHILEHEDMGMMGQFVVVDSLSDTVHIKSSLLDMPNEH